MFLQVYDGRFSSIRILGDKGIEFLQQTQYFSFIYHWNLMLQTFDISNID